VGSHVSLLFFIPFVHLSTSLLYGLLVSCLFIHAVIIPVLLLSYCCPIAVLLLSYSCPIAVLLLSYCCPIAVLFLSYSCPIAVLLLSYCCPIAVLLLHMKAVSLPSFFHSLIPFIPSPSSFCLYPFLSFIFCVCHYFCLSATAHAPQFVTVCM